MRDGKLSGCPTPMSRRLEHRNTSRRSFILFCCPWPVRAALYPSSGYIKDKNKLIEEGVSLCDVVHNDKNVRENNRVSNLISFYESLSKVCNISSNVWNKLYYTIIQTHITFWIGKIKVKIWVWVGLNVNPVKFCLIMFVQKFCI